MLRVVIWLLAVPALVAGVMMTLLRVGQFDQGLAVRVVSFAPLAIVAYAVAALLLAIPAVRGWSRARGGLVIALAGILVHGWWLAPYWFGESPRVADDAQPITVMTINVLGGDADAAQVVAEVRDRGVDLLAVQEITRPSLAKLDAAGLRSLLPARAGTPGSNVEGSMLFGSGELRVTGRAATAYDSVVATFRPESSSQWWQVLNVHARPPLESAQDWAADHREVFRVATQGEGADLVLGDFNATLDHEPMMRLADAGLRDAAELANSGWRPTWPVVGWWGRPLVAIDHVLAGPRLAVLDVSVVTIFGTDHTAVVAEVAARRVTGPSTLDVG